MHFLVYRITNTVTGKTYVGCHKTADVGDGYMGSGTALRRAKHKYGLAVFTREIICDCSSAEEMFALERDLVEIGSHTYNLVPGGNGAAHTAEAVAKRVASRRANGWWTPEQLKRLKERNSRLYRGRKASAETRQKLSELKKGRPPNNKGKPKSAAARANQSAALKGRALRGYGFKQSPEWKAAMSERTKGNKYAVGTVWTDEMRARLSASQKARRERERAERLRTA